MGGGRYRLTHAANQIFELTMSQSIPIRSGGAELIALTEPLWQKQKAYHLEIDHVNPDSYVDLSFEERMDEIRGKAEHLITLLAEDADTGKLIGYNLSTINSAGLGEIDSVFVEEDYRGKGIGTALIKETLEWMDENKAKRTKMHVLEANQSAFKLYRALGFEPRLIEMIHKTPASHRED